MIITTMVGDSLIELRPMSIDRGEIRIIRAGAEGDDWLMVADVSLSELERLVTDAQAFVAQMKSEEYRARYRSADEAIPF